MSAAEFIRSGPIDATLAVVDRARGRLDGATSVLADPMSTDAVISDDVKAFWRAWDQMPPIVAGLVQDRLNVIANVDLSDEGRRARFNPQLDAARATLDAQFETMKRAVERVTAACRDRAAVRRPEPVDAAQTALLAEAHEKWKMVLDALPPSAAQDRLIDFLREAMTSNDQLKIWALAEDDWPRLYLEARGDTERVRYPQRAQEAVAPMLPREAGRAREILNDIEGDSGLAGALHVIEWWLHSRLNEIKAL